MIKFEGAYKLDDFSQWCGNGFLYFKTSTDPDADMHIGSIVAYPEESIDDQWIARSIEGQEYTVYDYPFAECVFCHWPTCGNVNIEDKRIALLVERRQVQQYCRTYNRYAVDMKIPGAWELRRQSVSLGDINHYWSKPSVVRALFKPTYPTFEEALDMVSFGWYSVALNPRFAMVRIPSGSPRLYYGTQPVGSVVDKKVRPLSGRYTKLLERNFRGYGGL